MTNEISNRHRVSLQETVFLVETIWKKMSDLKRRTESLAAIKKKKNDK
jgi:hypothetical protein